MDALEFLKDDHRRVRVLFDEARVADGFKQRRRAFDSIKYELEAHAYIEEGVFYPTFRKDDKFKELLDHTFRQHQSIKDQLQALDEMGHIVGIAGEAQFAEKVEILNMTVERHFRDEETRFFSMVRKLMRQADRDRLGNLMQATRDELEWAA